MQEVNDDIPNLVVNQSLACQKKIPITIITGFLGAGKTTFLSHILKQNDGKKIVVVQNEFGERIGLEESMVIDKSHGKTGDVMVTEQGSNKVMEWIEFSNGCLCCTAKEEMLVAIEILVKKYPSIDAIFIETDGLVDPEPMVSALWVDAELESVVYLDAVICIVDSMYFLEEIGLVQSDKYKNEAHRQVAIADVILLNKVDLVENIAQLEMILSKINPVAKYYQTIKGQISVQSVLNINAFDKSSLDNPILSSQGNLHDTTIEALTIINDDFVTIEKINQWLASLLWENTSTTIYRIKGMINVFGTNEKYNLQGVMHSFDVQPSGILWELNETRTNKIVIIGKNLDDLQEDLVFN